MFSFNKALILTIQTLLLITFFSPVNSMERRRDQFPKEPGHYLLPTPIIYPGIGNAIALLGVASNQYDSYTDYAVFAIAGDITGFGGTVTDIHLIEKRLIGEIAIQNLGKMAINNYNTRGMASDKNDYSILELDDIQTLTTRLRGTFFDRMLEVQAMAVFNEFKLTGLRDKDGNLIMDTGASEGTDSQAYTVGLQLDWTDDFQDPRKGVRYSTSRWWNDEESEGASSYYQHEHNLTAYVPVGHISTWVFNYFQSDAYVTSTGDTDFASVESRMDLNCSDISLTSQQRIMCEQAVNNAVAQNRYGTAASMGGPARLRSYPEGRYSGAHTQFYGTEFRWNLTEEYKPFDIKIAKDIRTGIQLALFWETATVADEKDKLGDIWRDSYGVGGRFVTASGIVFRVEIATGDEGANVVMFFNYPWSDL